jgi:squalene monooxygenase
LEGIDSIEVKGYGVFFHGEGQKLTYPKHEGKTVLGRSFHHGRFVQKLREAAIKAPK